MTRRQDSSSVTWVGVGAGAAGVATYVLLVVTARALGAAAYGRFSVFWAAIVVTSLGAFLPIEQVVARRGAAARATGSPSSGLTARGVAVAWRVGGPAVLVAGGVLVVLGQDWSAGERIGTVVAFAVAVVGFVWQFPARGALAGRRLLREYAVVIVVDALLRALVVSVLAVLGVDAVLPYVFAVAAASLTCGLVGIVLARRHGAGEAVATTLLGRSAPTAGPATDAGTPARATASLSREVGSVVVAMLCMQGLLNSGVVIAALAAGSDAAVAGHLLAALTLARLPVFVLQAAQAAYVARVSALAHRGDRAGLRSLLLVLAAAVLGVAALTVAAGAVAGPAVVRLVFGTEFVVSTGAVTLVCAGIAAYLVASVSNDVTVAVGGHRWTAPAWLLGVAAAVLVAVLLTDVIARSTVPLVVGSVLAAAVLVPVVVARSRGVHRW